MKNVKEKLEFILILLSPITFGMIAIVALYIMICRMYFGTDDLNDYSFLVIPVALTYIFIWGKLFKLVTGRSWLD